VGSYRSGRAAAVCALLLIAGTTNAKAESRGQYPFDFPAENLSRSIRDLAALTGQNVIASDDLVRSREAAPLKGSFTAEQALAKLLEGTGLTYRRVPGSLVIERAAGTDVADAGVGTDSPEILVTGTHVRSAAPTSPVLTITKRDIDEAQPASVEELMRRLPQNLSAGVAQEK
jgi:iron complex outermembrane receptor protein